MRENNYFSILGYTLNKHELLVLRNDDDNKSEHNTKFQSLAVHSRTTMICLFRVKRKANSHVVGICNIESFKMEHNTNSFSHFQGQQLFILRGYLKNKHQLCPI